MMKPANRQGQVTDSYLTMENGVNCRMDLCTSMSHSDQRIVCMIITLILWLAPTFKLERAYHCTFQKIHNSDINADYFLLFSSILFVSVHPKSNLYKKTKNNRKK